MGKFINFYFILSFIITLYLDLAIAKKHDSSLLKQNSKDNQNQIDDKFYMVFIENTSDDNKDHIKRQEEDEENDEFVNTMVDEIHNLIMGNKNSYQDKEKFEEIEQRDNILKKRDSNVHYLKDYGDSSYVYPVFTDDSKTVLYAYLSSDLKKIVDSMPNVVSVNPPVQYEPDEVKFDEKDILAETKWSDLSVYKNSPFHLSLISQGTYDKDLIGEYDNTYYYPSTAGKDVDIFVFDGGFNFRHHEFSNKDEREAKCVIHIIDGKVADTPREDYCYSSEVSESDHGSMVATTAAGLEYGVAPKANIYGVLMETYDNGNAIAGLKYIKDNIFRPGKTVINFSFGGYTSYKNFTEDQQYIIFQKIINEMSKEGAVFVSSAGNIGLDTFDIKEDRIKDPCSFENEICVGGIGNIDLESTTYTKHKNSNYGETVDIYAPYFAIIPFQDKYFDEFRNKARGTSFSSPIVAGVAATIMSENPNEVFTTKSMLLRLFKLGERNVVKGIPEDHPNVFVNNGKLTVYSKNNEYNGCGVHAGNNKCSDDECCSVDGHCSKDENVCKSSEGCQNRFGICKIVRAPKGGKERCGYGIGSCREGYCCSAQGYCGQTSGHCGIGCQINYGICY